MSATPQPPEPGRARPAVLWLALATLVAIGAWFRLHAIPAPWGADALSYVECVFRGGEGAADSRAQRHVFLALVRGGLALSDGRPEGASWPGVAASAMTMVVLFLIARRAAAAWIAILPAAIWCLLGLDVEEVAEVSADCVTALPVALAALAFVHASLAWNDGRSPTRGLALCGVALGAAYLVKETAVFAAIGLAAAALLLGRTPRERLTRGATVVGALIAVLLVAAFAGVLQRPEVASAEGAVVPERIRPGDPRFLSRLFLDVPLMLLTATGAFGVLHLAALPLVARVAVRALRGKPLAVAACVSLLAFDLMPVSWERYALMTADLPRYVLPLMPLWISALSVTLAAAPDSRMERWAALAAAIAALAYAAHSASVVIAIGAVATAWTSLPERPASRIQFRFVAGAAAGALLWAAGSSLSTERARILPDPMWSAWPHLTGTGKIHAERLVCRRLAIAARTSPGADVSRLSIYERADTPSLAPGDWLLVQRDAATTDAHAALAVSGRVVPVPVDPPGETLWFRVR